MADFGVKLYRIKPRGEPKEELIHYDLRQAFTTGQQPHAHWWRCGSDGGFPSEWFKDNPGMKPPLHVPVPDCELDALRATIMRHVGTAELKLPVVKAYLFKLFNEATEKLDKRWVSFGRVIGQRDEFVGLGNIVDVTDDVSETIVTAAYPNVTKKADRWLAIYLCGLYRLATSRSDYRVKLAERLNNAIKKNGGPAAIVSPNRTHYEWWPHEKWFRVLIASIDMFLERFPHHKFAAARIGTETTRHIDCTVLADVMYICEQAQFTIPQLGKWMWQVQLADQLQNVLTPGNEIAERYSYMPYFMAMDLAIASPYSIDMNPDLHFWINVVGCCLNENRSIHSPIDGVFNLVHLSRTGIIFGFALATFLAEEDAEYKQEIPASLDGDDWLIWFKKHKMKTPNMVKMKLNPLFSTFTDTHEESVGQFMQEFGWW